MSLLEDFSTSGDYHQTVLAFCERHGSEGEEQRRQEEGEAELGKEREVRVGLKVGENESEELISHLSKEAHNENFTFRNT